MVVVLADIGVALTAQPGDEVKMGDEPGKLGNTALVGRQDVDDGAERGLVDDFVVLRFSATDTDDAVCHGFEGVHGRRIAVELVHDGIRAEHGTNVFGER